MEEAGHVLPTPVVYGPSILYSPFRSHAQRPNKRRVRFLEATSKSAMQLLSSCCVRGLQLVRVVGAPDGLVGYVQDS